MNWWKQIVFVFYLQRWKGCRENLFQLRGQGLHPKCNLEIWPQTCRVIHFYSTTQLTMFDIHPGCSNPRRRQVELCGWRESERFLFLASTFLHTRNYTRHLKQNTYVSLIKLRSTVKAQRCDDKMWHNTHHFLRCDHLFFSKYTVWPSCI